MSTPDLKTILENPVIELCTPYEDERGIIQNLTTDVDVKSVVMITSNKGAVRANHRHTADWHYCYVISGSIEYYWREVGSEEKPKMQVIEQGQLFYTPPNLEHAMVFPEDGAFLTISGCDREPGKYDDEIVKVKLV